MPTFWCPFGHWTCARDRRRRNYWRLPCKKHNTIGDARETMRPGYCPKSAKKEQVMKLLHRSERGLLNYDRCSKAEVQAFVIGRGLRTKKVASAGKKELVKLLEHADDAPQFSRFLDLPPELRVRVYELHFETLPAMQSYVRPPLVQVSKLVQEEAFPVFYQTCRFAFSRSDLTNNASLSRESQNMLTGIADKDLANVRKLELGFIDAAVFNVDITRSGSTVLITHGVGYEGHQDRYGWPDADIGEDRIKEAAMQIEKQGVPIKLRREDIKSLVATTGRMPQ